MIDNGILIHNDGSKYWYKDGVLHNDDGPAVTCPNGYQSWYQNGRLHRLNGPAIEWMNGDKEYWIDDVKYSPGEFNFRVFTIYHQKSS